MNIRKIAAVAALTVGASLVAAPAMAEGKGQQEKVWVCHVPPGNPDNAHLIHVGAASTQLEGHRNHELDTIGDGAQAACATAVTVIPTETTTVTAPPVTETVTAPPVTVTETVTETVTPTETVTQTAPPVTETEVLPGPTHTVQVPGPEEVVVQTAPPVTKTRTVAGPVTTQTSTVAGKVVKQTVVRDGKELAYTGFDIGITSLGVLLLGAGVLVSVLGRRVRNH